MAFLRTAVAYNRVLGIANKRLLTDTGSAFQSMGFARACQALVSWQLHRPHRGIGGRPPMSRLPASRHKLRRFTLKSSRCALLPQTHSFFHRKLFESVHFIECSHRRGVYFSTNARSMT